MPLAYRLDGDNFPQKTFPRGITADQDSAFSSRILVIVVHLCETHCRSLEGHRDAEARSASLIDWWRLVSPKCKDIVSHRKGQIRRSCRFTTNRTLGPTDIWDISRVHMSLGILTRTGPL